MFEGLYTAIVTPFTATGDVDFTAFEALIEGQISAGVDGIVPVGTTGESPTLDYEEHQQVIEASVRLCAGRCRVIAGTGANSTAEAVALTRHAQSVGADGTLQVTPYYNKPNQEGLYRHFTAVADLGLPVVLYNVPGRSALEIGLETVTRLAEHPSVVAIKEAAGSVERVSAILSRCDLEVLSGDDSLTFPMMTTGACGVISVTSNVAPREMVTMVQAALQGDWATAREIHDRLYPLFHALFLDTSPIPVKAALAMQGMIEERYRLPLCEMDTALKDELRAIMTRLDLL